MAQSAGRRVHLLQWDVARQPFETERYPLVNGATHPLVIAAVGAWARGAVAAWDADYRGTGDLLIGEAPLIGGRLMELVRRADDAAEALLSGERARFVLPVPSREARAAIEARRGQSIAAPRHENEAHDAPPDLLRALWQDMNTVAFQLGLAASLESRPYSPAIYRSVYAHLLSHRHTTVFDDYPILSPTASVYAGMDTLPNLQATPAAAARILARLEAQAPDDSAAWYDV